MIQLQKLLIWRYAITTHSLTKKDNSIILYHPQAANLG